jgi:hypothetical protein
VSSKKSENEKNIHKNKNEKNDESISEDKKEKKKKKSTESNRYNNENEIYENYNNNYSYNKNYQNRYRKGKKDINKKYYYNNYPGNRKYNNNYYNNYYENNNYYNNNNHYHKNSTNNNEKKDIEIDISNLKYPIVIKNKYSFDDIKSFYQKICNDKLYPQTPDFLSTICSDIISNSAKKLVSLDELIESSKLLKNDMEQDKINVNVKIPKINPLSNMGKTSKNEIDVPSTVEENIKEE